MTDIKALEKSKYYIECQCRPAKERKSEAVMPFITISRQAGAGGITIAQKLSQYLDKNDKGSCPWTVFDKNLISKVMEEHDLPDRFSPYMEEDKISEIDDTLDELFDIHPAKWTLVHKTAQTILNLAQMGRCILVGRGGNIVTAKLAGGFHVRLIGSFQRRTEHIQEYYDFSNKKASEFVKKEDKGRESYVKEYFGKNINDPLLYHLVINTDWVSYEEAAEIIGRAVLES